MADTGQGDQSGGREQRGGPDRDLDGHLGVLLAPDQLDRAADGGHRVSVLLGQQADEDVTHDPFRRPVVGGPVFAPHLLHPVVSDQPEGVEAVDHPVGDRGPRPGPIPGQQGHPAQHHPFDPVRHQRTEVDGHPTAEGVPDDDDPVGQHPWLLEEGEQLAGVLLGSPGLRRWRGGPESGQVKTDGTDRSGRVVDVEDATEVGVGAPPAVEGQNGGDPRSPSPTEQATVGERLQHRHTLPIASPPVEPLEPVPPTTWPAGSRDDPFGRAMADLTESQRQAVASPSEALCIIAGAGSGKTRVLTLRAARRIRDGSADADHTLICTFTRKAAHELRQRLRLYGVTVSTPAKAGGVPTPGVRAGTLHQLALTLLRRQALDAGRPGPAVAEHRHRTLTNLVGDPALASAVDTEIGWAKANCLTALSYGAAASDAGRPAVVSVDQVVDAFSAYEASLQRRRMLDLDDVLVRAADLVHDDSDFAERMRWRYRHLSVDEFQDVNPAQFRLILALLGNRRDLCAVGDPNQAIYGWNGADPGLLTRLHEFVDGLVVVRLDQNHRSSPQVVAAAVAALGTTVAVPPSSMAPDGPLPVVTGYEDDSAEAEGVAALLARRSVEGVRWSDQAVLARTHDQLSVVRQALIRAGIPHRMTPGREAAPRAVPRDPAGRWGRRRGMRPGLGPTPTPTPWSWRPSTGPRGSNGHRSWWSASRTGSCPSSTRSRTPPAKRSAACSTLP